MNMSTNELLREFQQFKKSIQGKDPQALLNGLLRSGRFSQADIQRAREMAELFSSFIK